MKTIRHIALADHLVEMHLLEVRRAAAIVERVVRATAIIIIAAGLLLAALQ